MLKLHIVQAEHGDCYVLEYGARPSPRYILIDGGPATIYEQHLRAKLLEIKAGGGKLDLAVVSHVDDDHIVGMLDLMRELKQQRASHASETVALPSLWHNTFSQILGKDVEEKFRSAMRGFGSARGLMSSSDRMERGIGQGDDLTRAADALGIPINPKFGPSRLICQDEAQDDKVFGNLSLRIVGPTKKNLERLRKEWLKWLKEHKDRVQVRDPVLAEREAKKADQSVPNLSSIMFLAKADGRTILFTGDGLSDDLIQGLKQAHLLDPDGKLHVDVLKLAHHGSQRNVKQSFFEAITADQYVISANGQNGNPDLATLKWMVETAKAAGRKIELVVTNSTDSTERLVQECPPDTYGYKLTQMEKGTHAMTLELAP